jgi:hypothetical protein
MVSKKKMNIVLGGSIFTALAGFLAPAQATVIYQSIPDLTTAYVNDYCSQCSPSDPYGGVGESIGQQFSLVSSATANYLSFTVDNTYHWPGSVTVSIFNDASGNILGSSVYGQTFTSFVSDVPTLNATDVVTVNLGAVPLAAGAYDLFLTSDPSSGLGIPVYSGGAGNGIYIATGSTFPPVAGLGYAYFGADAGISLSAPGPVPGASLLSFGFFILAGVWTKARGIVAR